MTLLAWIIALPPIIALGWFTLEILLGLKRLIRAEPGGPLPRTTILIPAHDEETTIARTLSGLLDAIAEETAMSILVVADNCSDATARIAREHGVNVVERSDAERRGKGYALAHGRDHLASLPADERPEAVIVLDADCRSDRASLALLARQAHALQVPVQASNLLASHPGAPPMVQISNFAMLVKNLVRARGMNRIGGGITLFGTGMGFPWPIFATAALASGDLVEDMKLALDLAQEGRKVQLVERARILSEPAASADMSAQRSRWEHGFLQTALSQALPLVARGVFGLSRHLFAIGMHLLVPPLALLFMLSFACLLTAALLALFSASLAPASVLLGAILAGLGAVVLAWRKEGRKTLTSHAILRVPGYVLWKIPLYLRFFRNRRTGWNRTRREGEIRD